MLYDDAIMRKIKIVLETERKNKMPIFEKDIADALCLSPANFSTMKKRNRLPLDEIIEFCAKRKININWILFDQIPDSLNEQTDRMIQIKHLNGINASAGGGAINDIDEYTEAFYPDYILASLGYKKHLQNLEIITITGDSMEPELSDGDKVFVDRNKVVPNEKEIFIVRTPNGLFVKRLKFSSDKKSVTIISSNSVYESESFDIDEVGVVGKVVAKF